MGSQARQRAAFCSFTLSHTIPKSAQFPMGKCDLTQASSGKPALTLEQIEEQPLPLPMYCLSLHYTFFFQTTPHRWAASLWRWKSWMWTITHQSLQDFMKLLFVKMPKQARWEMLVTPGGGKGVLSCMEAACQEGWVLERGLSYPHVSSELSAAAVCASFQRQACHTGRSIVYGTSFVSPTSLLFSHSRF